MLLLLKLWKCHSEATLTDVQAHFKMYNILTPLFKVFFKVLNNIKLEKH